ncbi:hypothetical protein EVAR_6776_1 [Eumeta japonica]|uniref:Uncharacterized protein n=1 Tax=Eumeta variegata TaxID=151549 RepID=A0A4C1V3P9_EUMVA|nr:hypothetical protein EVAR_6776_1 [Eumeta japonica]
MVISRIIGIRFSRCWSRRAAGGGARPGPVLRSGHLSLREIRKKNLTRSLTRYFSIYKKSSPISSAQRVRRHLASSPPTRPRSSGAVRDPAPRPVASPPRCGVLKLNRPVRPSTGSQARAGEQQTQAPPQSRHRRLEEK